MVKPGAISASPVANYTSQEALAPGRVSTAPSTWRRPYSVRADARANPLAVHLGLEPETRSPSMMLQLQKQRKFVIIPRKRSGVVLAHFSRTTGTFQLDKPAPRL